MHARKWEKNRTIYKSGKVSEIVSIKKDLFNY